MADAKDYIVTFLSGDVRRITGVLSDLQKLPVAKIEEAARVAQPMEMVRKDVERINRAIGKVLP